MERFATLLLVLLLSLTACEDTPPMDIQGHWYGFSEDGRYYELVIDTAGVKHFESYRLEEPFFLFPKSTTNIEKVQEQWQINFPDSQFVYLSLKNDSCLQFVNPENDEVIEQVLRFPGPYSPAPPQGAPITESQNYRKAFIQREVKQLARLHQLDSTQYRALLDSLNNAEEVLLNFYPTQQ